MTAAPVSPEEIEEATEIIDISPMIIIEDLQTRYNKRF